MDSECWVDVHQTTNFGSVLGVASSVPFCFPSHPRNSNRRWCQWCCPTRSFFFPKLLILCKLDIRWQVLYFFQSFSIEWHSTGRMCACSLTLWPEMFVENVNETNFYKWAIFKLTNTMSSEQMPHRSSISIRCILSTTSLPDEAQPYFSNETLTLITNQVV